MSIKTWDIVQPKDDWQKSYAHVEYLRTGLSILGGRKIEIKQVFKCMQCGADNTYWKHTCAKCEELSEMQ